MAEGLFRDEASGTRITSPHGSIRIFSPVSHDMWTGVAALVILSMLLWLVFGHYTRRVHVTGVLAPVEGVLAIDSPVAGTIVMKNISDGIQVHQGDVLLIVSSEHINASVGSVPGAIASQLRQDDQRIAADVEDVKRQASFNESSLRAQQVSLKIRFGQLNDEATSARRQLDFIEALLKRFEPLENKGFVSGLDIQQQRTQGFQVETQLKNAAIEREAITQQIVTNEEQLKQLPLVTQEKLSELSRLRSQNVQTLAQTESLRSISIIAPCDGVISALLVKNGQSITSGEKLFSILPKGSKLQGELFVPSEAVGFISPGATVALHYQAFPYQKFGVHDGTISSVGQSALNPSEISQLLGAQPPPEAYYRVEVELANQAINAYGVPKRLRSGMALDADIMLDRRRMIEWVFEPLYGMGRRAFHSAIPRVAVRQIDDDREVHRRD